MNIHAQVDEVAASAGALEGYVYRREGLEGKSLAVWVGNLVSAYELLPQDIRETLQPGCDRTLGRAVRSLMPLLGEDHELVRALRAMVKGPLPKSPDDFEKVKWFQE